MSKFNYVMCMGLAALFAVSIGVATGSLQWGMAAFTALCLVKVWIDAIVTGKT